MVAYTTCGKQTLSLEELIEKRKKIYSKADFEINCNKLSKTEIVKKIMILYEGN